MEVDVTTSSGRKLRAKSENLSLGGAMLTLSASFEVDAGETVELAFALPRPNGPALPITRKAVVRWTSELLPDLLGVAFEQPLSEEEAALVEGLLP
jgi:hypothetical protein